MCKCNLTWNWVQLSCRSSAWKQKTFCCWVSIKLTFSKVMQSHFGRSTSRLELWRPRPQSCLPPYTTLLQIVSFLSFRNLTNRVSSFTDCHIGRFVLSLMTPFRGEAAGQWRQAPKSAWCCGRTGSYARDRRYGGGRSLSTSQWAMQNRRSVWFQQGRRQKLCRTSST